MDESGGSQKTETRPELKIRNALYWLLVPLAFLNLFLFLHARAVGRPGWEWALYALAGASGTTLFAGWLITIRGLQVPAISKLKRSEVPDDCRRVAVLVVHGMGVQDRYQTLSDFASAVPTHTRQREGEVVPLEGEPGDDHVPIWDGDRCRIDFHEAYWGHVFNRLTKPLPACVFMVKALLKFVPTMFTRLWPKRLFEAVFAAAAVVAIYFLVAWSYCGFVLGARTLDTCNANVKAKAEAKAGAEAKTVGIGLGSSAAGLVFPTAVLDSMKTAFASDAESNQVVTNGELPDPELAIVHGYDTEGKTIWKNLEGGTAYPPKWPELTKEYNRFAWLAARKAWQSPWKDAVDVTDPWSYVEPLPRVFVFLSAAYGVAYGLLLLSVFRLLAALWHYLLTFRAKSLRPEKHLLSDLRTAIGGTVVPTVVCLALYPNLDVLVIEFLMAVAVLVLTYKGFCWWVVNYFGDVQIYATLNANEATCEAREKATNLVAERIVDLLRIDDQGRIVDDGELPHIPLYDRVVVVAHSLGSVIALHAIRRLHLRGGPYWAELEQRCVFVTIGSPLRKFRQLFQAMPYRWYFADDDVSLDSEIFIGEKAHAPDHIPWFNYWYTNDIFADRLAYLPRGDFRRRLSSDGDATAMIAKARKEGSADLDRTGFPVGAKRDRHLGIKFRLWPHSDYWIDNRFVDDLLDFAAQDMNVVKMMQVPVARS